MTSPTAQPKRPVASASHPNLRRPTAERAALPAHPAANTRHNTDTTWSTGRVAYAPRHPQTHDAMTSTAATPYPPTTSQPTRAGSPKRCHGFSVQRFGWGLWLLALSSAVMCVAAYIVATQIAGSLDVRIKRSMDYRLALGRNRLVGRRG